MSKLNFINERPEFEKDPRWQEAGDRYMIKLFRDYIFHQVNEMGVPVVDMGHVMTCINKVSSGVVVLRARPSYYYYYSWMLVWMKTSCSLLETTKRPSSLLTRSSNHASLLPLTRSTQRCRIQPPHRSIIPQQQCIKKDKVHLILIFYILYIL